MEERLAVKEGGEGSIKTENEWCNEAGGAVGEARIEQLR